MKDLSHVQIPLVLAMVFLIVLAVVLNWRLSQMREMLDLDRDHRSNQVAGRPVGCVSNQEVIFTCGVTEFVLSFHRGLRSNNGIRLLGISSNAVLVEVIGSGVQTNLCVGNSVKMASMRYPIVVRKISEKEQSVWFEGVPFSSIETR